MLMISPSKGAFAWHGGGGDGDGTQPNGAKACCKSPETALKN